MSQSTVTVVLPDIGEGTAEGEVIEWLKQEGESVQQDEPVVSIMTDKATVELPAPHSGILAKQYYHAGEVALVDQPLYDLTVSEISEPPPIKKTKPKSRIKEPVMTVPVKGNKAIASPPVRKLAKEMGINLSEVTGTGAQGIVIKRDLQQYMSKKEKEPLESFEGGETIQVTGIRRLMAEKMSLSKHNAVHFSYFEQVDAARLIKMHDKLKKLGAIEGERVTYMPLFIRALSITLGKYPIFNSSYDAARQILVKHQSQNIGIAISSENGLIVPVLTEVQNMNLRDLIHAYNLLINKAKTNALKAEQMKNSTFTITNFGTLGEGLWATPVINYPEIGILGLAKIKKEPIVKNDQIVIGKTLNLSWSFDHRVIDGEMASTFSHEFTLLLQNPASIL